MQKILSLVVFTVALIWTWNLIHSSPAVGFETHSGIQEKLAVLITETVKSKKPNAQEFQITRLWTETLDDHKVRAVFTYRFKEAGEGNEVTDQVVDGEAFLHREPNENPDQDKWVVQQVRTTSGAVNFTEGVIVTPAEEADEADPTVNNPSPSPITTEKSTEKAPEKTPAK